MNNEEIEENVGNIAEALNVYKKIKNAFCRNKVDKEELPLLQRENGEKIEIGELEVGENFVKESPGNIQEYSSVDSAKGLLLAFLGAGVMYGLTSVLVRLAAQNGVGAVQLLFVRSLFQTILFSILLKCKSLPLKPPSGRTLRCVGIAVVYTVATLTSYEAFNLIPPGSAIATRGATRNIFAIVLSFVIVKEKVKPSDFLVIILCIGGITMIISGGVLSGNTDYILAPGFTSDPIKVLVFGFILIICAGITRSLGLIMVRIIKDEIHTFAIVTYHSFLTLTVTLILVFTVRSPVQWPPSKEAIGYTAAVCGTSAIATFSSNKAVRYVHPALVSLGQNADIFVSIALEHIILKMAPQVLEITGACLIAIAISGLTIYRYMESKKRAGFNELEEN